MVRDKKGLMPAAYPHMVQGRGWGREERRRKREKIVKQMW